MAAGRFLSRGVSQNEQLAQVSLPAALLFTWAVSHLDREGRITGNPELLKSIVCPLRAEITPDTIPDLIEELRGAVDHNGRPLVHWYAVGSTLVLAFPGFDEQQKGLRKDREAESRLPAPDHPNAQPVTRPSGPTPDKVRSNAGPTPAEEKLRVREVQEEGTGAKAPERGSTEELTPNAFRAAVAERIRKWKVVPADIGPEISIAQQWLRDRTATADEILALIENAQTLQSNERPSLKVWHAKAHRESLQTALGMVRKRLENQRARERREQRGNVGDVLGRTA